MADALLKSLLDTVLSNWHIFAALLAVLVVTKICRSPLVKGWWGELQVTRFGLRRLDPAVYRVFDDLYLPRPDGKGTTQIDHVVVSPFGVFVIETKNYQGWIFGSARQAQWTQQIYRVKSRFQNPLHQNHLHVKALMSLLGLPAESFHSLVMFIGDTTFKTPMPDNVINRGLISWIRAKHAVLLESAPFERASRLLHELQTTTNRRKAKRAHLAQMNLRQPD